MKKFMIAIAVAGLAVSGCAKKSQVKPQATPEAQASTTFDSGSMKRVVVKSGDNLWKISARKSGLGDPFRWPLIFKANRDQIQDPDFIDVSQDLKFKKNYTKEEIADAVKKAKLTPPFEPRQQPRKVLPIQY